jgi:hypothetical protein
MPMGCVWPVNCQKPCGSPAQHGRLCTKHLERVHAMVGTLVCAWPGCTRRAWDHRGVCSFHRQVTAGLVDR